MEHREGSPTQATGITLPTSQRTTVDDLSSSSHVDESPPQVNLLEWLGTRVLARVSGGGYQPGSIKNVHDNKDVVVQFDDGQEQRFDDVMNETNSNLIIADQAPTPSMVCLHVNSEDRFNRSSQFPYAAL
ncbi:hypothetical protein GCK32_017760 [Trichostrongylus colubriformis]|uniref:Uncharacterized protein n=1 Tax=Trichostrongylus colubriformis TaxID=6319 RepID=A0AAN8J2Y1_TRICO